MKNSLLHLVVCVFLCSSVLAQKNSLAQKMVAGKDYQPGLIVLKFKSASPAYFDQGRILDPEVAEICASFGEFQLRPLFPHHPPGARVDLSGIVELQYKPSVDILALADRLRGSAILEYAQPRLIRYAVGGILPPPPYLPNDPQLAQQWNLNQIKAPEAWDLEKGDSSILIGFIDTGADWQHPDLAPNIALNLADPINGLDDDGNGFVDDYRGWDFGNGDNDPYEAPGGAFHGTATAGIAAAATDNGIGIASPGFHSRILIVKTHDDALSDLSIIHPAEAIVYAADRGCKVINNSWGGTLYDPLEADAVRYATLEKDALVIAAAGNYNSTGLFYPAAYPYVLNVGGSVQGDVKYDISNYGHSLDVVAPTLIQATFPGGGYGIFDGTSSAAPMASGAAALVRAHFPQYSALQAGEQIRMTCDNIDGINPNYAENLGRGRINLYRALSETGMPSVRMDQISISDGNDGIFEVGDTLRLRGVLTNFLSPVANLKATLVASSNAIEILNPELQIGMLGAMDTLEINQQPFLLLVHDNLTSDASVDFKLVFNAANYADFQWVGTATINPSYRNLEVNQLKTTVTARGRLGFNNDLQTQGIGLNYEPAGGLSFFSLGLMMGNSSVRLSNSAWKNDQLYSNDFKIVEKVNAVPGALADVQLTTAYNDSLASLKMGLSIRQNTFAWATAPDDRYFIVEYNIRNNSAQTYNDFYVGLHYETDLVTFSHNKATQDSTLRMGYAWNTDTDIHSGIRLLSPALFNMFAYDWNNAAAGIDVSNGFSSNEKFKALKGGHPDAGLGAADGSDVGLVVSAGPISFQPGDSLRVAFAVVAANSLAELKAGATAAGEKYAGITTALSDPVVQDQKDIRLYPNPVTDILRVQLADDPHEKTLKYSIEDLGGQTCKRVEVPFTGNGFELNTAELLPGYYILKCTGDHGVWSKGFVKVNADR